MTDDHSWLLKSNDVLAKFSLDEFEAPPWTQDFSPRWRDLARGTLALDLASICHDEGLSWLKKFGHLPRHPVRYLPIGWILAEVALLPPHGLEVLSPPFFPDIARAATIAVACKQGDLAAIRTLMQIILRGHPLPWPLAKEGSDFALDVVARVALCTVEVPDFTKLPIVKMGANWNWTDASEAQRKLASQGVLHALCIRAAYLVAKGDPGDFFDTVAVNARQKWFDPATGHPKEGIVASFQAPKNILCQLDPERLDPTSCFRHLSGISSPNLLNATPIRPIFVMNTNDNRIVASKDVTSQLQEATNLAAMPWEDFEHLVSQIFEWLFATNGVEVKVTRASRDRGVDAIMFDPDPIRGGKYVLQAKRYTHAVDVAAVRDLYGTVINEGANRGILVTTASYGPDAYEFAKDKPISLIDGPNLIALLKKHGRIYRIDLEEARRANEGSLAR